jgi:dihydrodipicolinate synthase/N-acetylneuraminate lyase/uridine kinase
LPSKPLPMKKPDCRRNMHRYKQHVRPKDHGRISRRPVEHLLADVIVSAVGDRPGPLIIAVGGPGGTGKSTFAHKLAERLDDAAVLRLDDYKTARAERQKAGIFGPHPDANKMAMIAEHLGRVRQGQPFDQPVYDSSIGDAGSVQTYQPVRFNIIDGEVSTYREFRELVDFAIFIDSDWRTQLATRLGRDLAHRNYSPEKAIATFLHSNLREFSEHGADSKNWADAHLYCHDDYRLELESISRELYEQVRDMLHEDVEAVELAGLIVPLLTPFAAEGKIDECAFVDHLEFLSRSGVRRVLVGGTTGEFFSLTVDERLELLKLALEYFPGLVLFQAGGGPLPETLDMACKAQQLGADGILCLPPSYYAAAPEEGVVAYFSAVAAAVEVPLILYNYPHHTQNPLTPAILRRVEPFGMKDSSGDLSLIKVTPRYFVGDDTRICRALRAGAIGFVSAAANALPELHVSLDACAESHCWQEAESWQVRICELLSRLGDHQIPAIKRLVRERIESYPAAVRPPLAPLPLDQDGPAA